MPRYEALFILRALQRPDLVQILKRSALSVMDRGGILQTVENLGYRMLPYKMRNHGKNFHDGNYFLLYFAAPSDIIDSLKGQFARDQDIIRANVYRREIELERPCERGPCVWGEMTNEKYRLYRSKEYQVAKKVDA